MNQDIRWKQRFHNFKRAYLTLQEAVQLSQTRALTNLEKQGIIQGFEFTHELAWNVLKDYLQEQGIFEIIGSKNATREAFKQGLISEGEAWMKMIAFRNLSFHTYNQATANEMEKEIIDVFFPCFSAFLKTFDERA